IPFRQDLADLAFATLDRDHEHTLLRLAEEDLVRRHAGFAHGHLQRVDQIGSHFARISRTLPSRPLIATTSIRSCDSLRRISYGVMPDSRTGTFSVSIRSDPISPGSRGPCLRDP